MNDNILLILMLIALCVLIFRLPEIIRAIKQPSQVSRKEMLRNAESEFVKMMSGLACFVGGVLLAIFSGSFFADGAYLECVQFAFFAYILLKLAADFFFQKK